MTLIKSCDIHGTVYYKQCRECLHDLAKSEKQAAKKEAKEKATLLKAKEMDKQPRASVKKVSDKRKEQNKEYSELREQFLLGRWCAYHGNPCIPTTVHHSKGRIGDLLTDTRYFVALCMEAHQYIESHPNWAKEHGFSASRLAKYYDDPK